MEVKEAKLKQVKLEQKLKELITEFENETGLVVRDLEISRVNVGTTNEPNKSELQSVWLSAATN